MGTKKLLLIAAALVIVLVGVLVGVKYASHKSSTPVTASPYTKGQLNNSNGNGDNTNKSKQSSSNNPSGSSTGPSQQTTLIAPFGNFVSDHNPNLSGSPHPNLINSVCSSNPGATCQISFSNGSETKNLPPQTTDAGGSTYWSWHLQDIGLTVGSWKIKATATLGSETKSTTDPMVLQVSP